MTEDQIKYMVSRFLGWRLPEDAEAEMTAPDFAKESRDHAR